MRYGVLQNMKVLIIVILAVALASCGGSSSMEEEEGTLTDSGLRYIVTQEGDGPSPETGDIVAVHYTGKLEDGTEFDSSLDDGQPLYFILGKSLVIAGWDEGIALLQEGAKATLTLPPDLAYGETGAGDIPPDSTLIFDVELVSVHRATGDLPEEVAEGNHTTTDTGLMYYDFEVGQGSMPGANQSVLALYTLWLDDGTVVASSWGVTSLNDLYFMMSFSVTGEQMPTGLSEGLTTMSVGGRRQLVIPPELAYGEEGSGDLIPPNSTLIIEIELLGID
jgi:FKBP-type peptidyl-prolyl cis-trans isomerase